MKAKLLWLLYSLLMGILIVGVIYLLFEAVVGAHCQFIGQYNLECKR